jgi:deoxyribodipyrimidine photo-lyase
MCWTTRRRAIGGWGGLALVVAWLAGQPWRDLAARGSRLVLRRGEAGLVLAALAQETGAREVHALHHYEPWWRNAEKAVRRAGLDLHLHDGNFLLPPGSVSGGAGALSHLHALLAGVALRMPPAPPLPARQPAHCRMARGRGSGAWGLRPQGPTGQAAFARMDAGRGGCRRAAGGLPAPRPRLRRGNLPSVEGTSRLSPHLAFGEISPATLARDRRAGSVKPFFPNWPGATP